MNRIDTLAAASVIRFTAASSNDELVHALQLSDVRGSARAVLVSLCATASGANRVAEILTAYAELNAEELKAYAADKAAGRKVETPECVSTYVQVRRMAEKAKHAFTIAKRGGAESPCYVPVESKAPNAKSSAAKKSRVRAGKPARALTPSEACARIRRALNIADADNSVLVQMIEKNAAAIAAMLAPAPATKRPTVAVITKKAA